MALTSWSNAAYYTGSGGTTGFRQWMNDINAAVIAAGLVQTSDTGQINRATAVLAGDGVAVGYEMFRFDDALQGSYPVFVKIEYGSAGAGSMIGVWVTVGTSTDGAGTLGTIKTTRVLIHPNGTSVSTLASFISGGSSRLTFCGFHDSNSTAPGCFFFNVERFKTTAGSDANTGVAFCYAMPSANVQQSITFSGTQPAAMTVLGSSLPTGVTTWANGADIHLGPVFPRAWGLQPANTGVLSYFTADLTRGVPVTISVYGANHSYLPLSTTSGISGLGVNSSAALLVRYD